MAKLHIKKGDLVRVLSGDDRGNTGRVLEVFPSKMRAIVEGVNIVTKHRKPTQQNPQGERLEKEAPLHISNLMIVDPKTNKPTRISRKKNEKGIGVRVAKKSGEILG